MNKKIVYQYPQYGFGSWLKENAGMVGTIAGGGLGMLIGNPMLGASIGGSIGGAVQQKTAMEVANQEQADLLAKQTGIQTALTNAQNMNLPTYGANFATGGNLNFKSPAAYKAWLAYGHASGEFAKTPGHQKVSIKGQPKKVQHADGGNIGMTGMMKARMALANEFGNNAAKRMVSSNPKTGMTPEGIGTHYMTSIDNYAVPLLQDLGQKSLTYVKNPTFNPKEDIKFERPEDAEYFAKNYKDVAPMMKSYVIDSLACGGKLKAMGGTLESSDKLDGITLYQNGGTHEESPLGGVPIGRLGRVEEGEVRIGNYVFSNRIPYNKK